MLQRSIAAGRGEALKDVEGSYAPQLVLNGYGQLTTAPDNATPLSAPEFSEIRPSNMHPAGLYKGPAGTRALNVGTDLGPNAIENWPLSARLLGDAETRSLRLAGPLLVAAAILLTLDFFVALFVAGKFSGRRRKTVAAALIALCAVGLMPTSDAQSYKYERSPDGSIRVVPTGDLFSSGNPDVVRTGEIGPDIEASLELRFAYVQTGDSRLDERTAAGLVGLSRILNMRTSVEPAAPHGVNLEEDPLEVYPLIYFNIPDGGDSLSDTAIGRLNAYLRSGGALIIDTRAGGIVGTDTDVSGLENILAGLDAPPLEPVPTGHVLARSYYLIDDFPGRYAGRRVWIENTGAAGSPGGDGVSRLFIGDADWASAWATDERGRDLYSVDGGPQQRETSRRFGVNLAMYVLTGNYKDDQVHLPALLERLGEDDESLPSPTEGDEP